jgi:hypothetical protein
MDLKELKKSTTLRCKAGHYLENTLEAMACLLAEYDVIVQFFYQLLLAVLHRSQVHQQGHQL